jgi:hypothetical protein
MYCQWGLPLLKYGGVFFTFLQYSIPLPLQLILLRLPYLKKLCHHMDNLRPIKSNQFFLYMRQWFNFIGHQKNIHLVTQSL